MSTIPEILQTPTNLPEPPKVPHTPLGGKVGIPDGVEAEIIAANEQSIVSTVVSDHIELSYGENQSGEVLNHLRRRNLGYC